MRFLRMYVTDEALILNLYITKRIRDSNFTSFNGIRYEIIVQLNIL